MKRTFLKTKRLTQLAIFFSLLLTTASNAQVVQAWDARYNSADPGWDSGNDIAVDGNGNVYVTGYSSYYRGEGLVELTADIVTIKYNSKGEQLWLRVFNGPADKFDVGSALALDPLGNVYVTGYSEIATDNEDIVVIKYSTNGDQLWVKNYNGPANTNDRSYAISVDAAYNVYVTGERDGDIHNQLTDIVTIKYNTLGVQQWVQSYAGAGNKRDAAYAMIVPGDGSVYITGEINENGVKPDYILIKYNTSGAVQWIQSYDGPGHDYDIAYDIDVDLYGNVYITGGSIGSGTNYDFATVKYDKNGNHKWNKRYHNTERDIAIGVEVDNMNNVIVSGSSLAHQDRDFATIKYDSLGNELWNRRYYIEDGCDEMPSDLAVDAAGNVYVTGYSNDVHSCRYSNYATVKYLPNGDRDWVKHYTGSGKESIAKAMALDSKGNVYITGESLEGPVTELWPTNFALATVKYAKCVIIPPANVVVNNTTGQCGANVTYAAATTSGYCGTLTYSKASGSFFPVGVTTVTVSSPSTGEISSFTVTVVDAEAPKISCPAPVTVNCAALVPAVSLASVTATDNCGEPTVTHVGDVISNQVCANRYTITRTYKATDAAGNSATCSQVIIVYDDVAPQINGMTVSQQLLWPPDHTMRDVTVDFSIVDNCVNDPYTTITVTSNEPVNGTADGDTDPDWQILDLHHLKLRAERASNGNGRVYTIKVTVDDGCNPAVTETREVYVPHNYLIEETLATEPTEETVVDKLQVKAFPNPSNQFFTLQVNSKDRTGKVQVFVYDQNGRLVEQKNNVNAGALTKFGENYKAGVYYVKVVQGDVSEEVKIVKVR